MEPSFEPCGKHSRRALRELLCLTFSDLGNFLCESTNHFYLINTVISLSLSLSLVVRDNESKMIEKIARDVSNALNATISMDFENVVAIEAHLHKMQSLLQLDYEDEAMIVGICGPAGIGKTTIARALHSRFSSSFQLNCFVENLRGSYNSGIDEYGLKLGLQEQLLSRILNQNGLRIHHLGAIRERLCDQKVLIILDDVDDLQQLEALANETNWFGPGSRIIVTTEDQELLVYISARAFTNMCNLRFISIYETRRDTHVRVHVPEDMDFPPRLSFLHWEVYPGKCLPCTFRPEYLVELNLQNNKLEKLWEGTQKMVLSGSLDLKELPNLSNATNLERLDLSGCWSLIEIPSSIGNLHKLEELEMNLCISLQVVPTHFNLASLESVRMVGCMQLRKIPDISTNITSLIIGDTMLEEFPESIRLWFRLQTLSIYGSIITLPLLTKTLLERSGADIEKIPDWIKDLHGLKSLYIGGCPKLASLPELPGSLRRLTVETCESLQTVSFRFDSPFEGLYFPNCFKLGGEARRVITQQSYRAYVPGKEIPAEFDHRAIGNSLTHPSSYLQV